MTRRRCAPCHGHGYIMGLGSMVNQLCDQCKGCGTYEVNEVEQFLASPMPPIDAPIPKYNVIEIEALKKATEQLSADNEPSSKEPSNEPESSVDEHKKSPRKRRTKAEIMADNYSEMVKNERLAMLESKLPELLEDD